METVLRPEGLSYEPERILGEGGSSIVYKARRWDQQLHLEQIVALKFLKNSEDLETLRREFSALIRVRSENCVAVWGWESFRNQPALVLEWIDGVSLEKLSGQVELSPAILTEVVAQIYHGLMDLAEAGICHGDLSPRNVLIDRSGRVKLVDFGLAGARGTEAAQGTLPYLSPERWAGAEPTLESDIYALGCMVRELSRRLDTCPDGIPVSNWCSLQPQKRITSRLPSDPGAQKALAALVTQSLAGGTTKNLFSFEQRSQLRLGSVLPAACVSMLLFSSWVVVAAIHRFQPGSSELNEKSFRVEVRARDWVAFRINGRLKGFTPREIHLSPGVHVVAWRGAHDAASETLRIGNARMVLIQRGGVVLRLTPTK